MTKTYAQDDKILNQASLITSRDKQYSDFNLIFKPRLGDADLYKVADVAAVLQAVKTLILTNTNERPFNSNIGANVEEYLFEPNDEFVQVELESNIRQVIATYEPRAKVTSVTFTGEPSSTRLNMLLEILIVATQEIATLNINIERLR